MKDKEKQIEEIAKDKQWQRRDSYCLRIQKALQYKGAADNEDVPSILVDFENEIRKEMSPKDSVVLPKEEYDDLVESKRQLGCYIEDQAILLQGNIPQGYTVLSREEYDTLKAENDKYVKNCIDYIATINKLENKVWEVEQQASNETAEKIFAKEREFIYSKWKSYITMNDLIEIAKQFGVEIKE